MKSVVRCFCAVVLILNSACGGQKNSSVDAAIDAESVMVNKIDKEIREDGQEMVVGKIGIVRGAKTEEELNNMVDNGEISFLSENQLAEYGFSLVNDGENKSVEGEQFGWAAIGAAFFFGAWLGTASSYNRCYSCGGSYSYRTVYYTGYPVYARASYGGCCGSYYNYWY